MSKSNKKINTTGLTIANKNLAMAYIEGMLAAQSLRQTYNLPAADADAPARRHRKEKETV
ncbi:hypothetical protein FACS1894164_19270 [Spirochaetia bacterium]|nr:hypothetical protein FACS1894164_19270 [Spirochaetia bacterium]